MNSLKDIIPIDTEIVSIYQSAVVTSIITGIVLLVSLAWNDVVKALINKYFPSEDNNSLKSKFFYALLITFIVIVLQIYFFPLIKPDYTI
jgi:uncharacterized membrane protein